MNKRCEEIIKILNSSAEPVSASKLAEILSVSRQIIVGDVALLRASGTDITSTSRGYVIDSRKTDEFGFVGIIACRHEGSQMKEELYTVVDYGGTVIDVSIEHAIYGELSGKLDLSSRYDVDRFIKKVSEEENSAPISSLTGGVHLHRIGCRSEDMFLLIKERLTEKGIALK